jgi:hypothetical protein
VAGVQDLRSTDVWTATTPRDAAGSVSDRDDTSIQ